MRENRAAEKNDIRSLRFTNYYQTNIETQWRVFKLSNKAVLIGQKNKLLW
jgi:hypothetical protein